MAEPASPTGPVTAATGWAALKPVLVPFVPQIALAPALFFIGVTFLHEAAHAVVSLALGGTVTEFAFLPGAQALGHVRWEPPPHAPAWMGEAVSVAPYVMWAAVAAGTLLLAGLNVRIHRWVAAGIFYWCYFVPLGDIAWNLYGGRGDLAVGGADGLIMQVIGAVALLAAFALGYGVQRRLFRQYAVGGGGYVICAFAIGGASAIAAAIGLAIFSALS
jgi:hypothetical protein